MKTRTIILGLIVIIIIAIAVFLIYSLTHVSGFELRDEHRALIGMASPDTKSSGDCIQGDCTIANDKNKLNDMADFISEYSKKNPQGLCFKCNAGTPKNPVDVDSANKNNVFPNAEADFWKARKDMNKVALTYSSKCVKGFYNCADVVLDDGKQKWEDIHDCYSFGNGICGGDGGREAKCNPGPVGQPANLSAEGNCSSCTPGNVPETSPSDPYRCAPDYTYNCIQTFPEKDVVPCQESKCVSNGGIKRSCVIADDGSGTYASLDACQTQCVATEGQTCDENPNDDEWCANCSTDVFGENCDEVCDSFNRTQYAVDDIYNGDSTSMRISDHTTGVEGSLQSWKEEPSPDCWQAGCSCFPKSPSGSKFDLI